MARTRDLYEVLGISRDASQEEIKRAYRRLARNHHPDVSDDPDAEHKFKEINLAYQTLSDPAKRRQYDMYGGEGFTPDMFDFMGDITDIFEAFFGAPFGRRHARHARRTARGSNVHVGLELTFEEAAFGVTKEVSVERLSVCDTCGGSGAEPGSTSVRCSRCGGTGEVSDVRRSMFGTIMATSLCATCGGSGREITRPCSACRGEGRTHEVRNVSVEVPAGVADQMDLRMEGVGQQGRRGAPAGDLYLTLHVASHPLFERHGQDLHAVLGLPVTQAVLGTRVEIETLDGPETIKIPAGTPSGTVIRLRGRGVPNLGRRGRGDLYIEVEVVLPETLSQAERSVFEHLAEIRDELPGEEPVRGRLRRRS